MRVLVTGGAGFIGSHIVESLRDHDLLVVDDLSIGNKEWVQCPLIVEDVAEPDRMESVIGEFKPDVVIHAAAQVMLRESLEDPIEDARRNIIGTLSVLEAARKCGTKRFIYLSTGGARYGDPERLPLRESDPPHPVAPYGISKHSAEHYVEAYSKMYGISSLILCFGNVYGPRDDPKKGRVISVFLTKMLAGDAPRIYGDGEQTRDFLYVGDIVELICANLTKTTAHMLYNIASGEQTSVNEIFALIESELKTGLKPIRTEAVRGEVRDNLLDISLAREELGFRPTRLRDGIKMTIPWYAARRSSP